MCRRASAGLAEATSAIDGREGGRTPKGTALALTSVSVTTALAIRIM
jgi:hypothetical protein